MQSLRVKPFNISRAWSARLRASPIACRLAAGTFWSVAGAMSSRGLNLIASILVARMLGKVGFGELGMIQSTLTTLGVFSGLAMGVTATKHVAQLWTQDPARAGRILALSNLVAWSSGLVMVILLQSLAPWLAVHTLAAPHLASMLRIGSFLVLLGAVNGAQTGALSGYEAFRQIAAVNFYSALASFPVLLCGVKLDGLRGAVCALIFSQALNCWLTSLTLRRELVKSGVVVRLRGCLRDWQVLWWFSLPAVLSGALVGPIDWVCNALLVHEPSGYEEMAVFAAANQWFSFILFVPIVLSPLILSMLSERIGKNDPAAAGRVLWLAIKLNGAVVLPLVGVGCVASPYIMKIYGRGFENSWPTLCIVLMTGGLLAVQTPVGQIIAATGRMWMGAMMNFGWAVSFLTLAFLLVNRGAIGLASARFGAYSLHAIWTIGFAAYYLRLSKLCGVPTRANQDLSVNSPVNNGA
jgi:O-antigen/teichoic acid export membrane protein